MTVKEILQKWLTDRGFDGLYNDECGCYTDDLIPCCSSCESCMPGYKIKTPEGHEFYGEAEFLIGPQKDES